MNEKTFTLKFFSEGDRIPIGSKFVAEVRRKIGTKYVRESPFGEAEPIDIFKDGYLFEVYDDED